jgi:FKBP-type peptidyl-prolyl cis-trans isomerase
MGKKDMFGKLQDTMLDGFEPVQKVDELTVIDNIIGNGPECTQRSVIKAHYTGARCKDGVIFESSHDDGKPLMFRLQEVIEGWQEGLLGMRQGGQRRLIVPASMAYGNSSPSKDIPKNSDLVFDIEVMEIRES